MKNKQYFIVGSRPVFFSPKEDGSLHVLAFNWETGQFENDMSYYSKVFYHERDDTEELSEEEFNTKVSELRKVILNKTKRPFLIDEIQYAWKLASKMHFGQKYGGQKEEDKIEYLTHIGSVVFEILAAIEAGNKVNKRTVLLCAILHDTLEDSTLAYEDLKRKFGQKVADGVLGLTKNEKIVDEKAKMIDSLKRIKNQSYEVWMVKLADRIANLHAPPYYWTTEKRIEYREESKLIHQELHKSSKYLANRLAEKIKSYSSAISNSK